jgi:ribonuclease-3
MKWVKALWGKLAETSDETKPVDQETAQKKLLHKNIRKFERIIGYSIRNEDVFVQALLHRSFLQRSDRTDRSNERLEFFGDSILNLIVAEYLYHHYPDAEEGELTKIRSRLVNRKALAAYARQIHLSDFILMSSSAAQAVGKGADTIVSDTYEAIVAAIYLDGGYEAARRFVERQILSALSKGTVLTSDDNYKSRLLEYSQSKGLGIPRYLIVKEEGPDHDRTFTVEVMLNNMKLGEGTGKNKKEAEQAAASRALETITVQ